MALELGAHDVLEGVGREGQVGGGALEVGGLDGQGQAGEGRVLGDREGLLRQAARGYGARGDGLGDVEAGELDAGVEGGAVHGGGGEDQVGGVGLAEDAQPGVVARVGQGPEVDVARVELVDAEVGETRGVEAGVAVGVEGERRRAVAGVAGGARGQEVEVAVVGVDEEGVARDVAADPDQVGLADQVVLECIVSCLLYTSQSPRDRTRSRMPSSA